MTILRSPPSAALAPPQRRTVRPFYTNPSVLLSRRSIAIFTRPCGSGAWRPDDVDERGLEGCRRGSTTAAAAKRLLAPARAASNPLAAGGGDGENERSLREVIVRAGEVLSMAFPLWVGSACVLALWKPSSFLWAHKNWQILGLTLTMLGMGMTLTLQDLRSALLMPKELAAGFVLQYTVMPLSGCFVSKLLNLPSHYAAGLYWLLAALEAQQVTLLLILQGETLPSQC